ncbi:hypothetical protein TrLO_g9420 [Triparma laevis f. longispina]|uniref:Uncharacterized protein n=1 Tax=Triparma laevis f. longispina TaxID=1714387 RepID=A0A9W6ZDE9_9STRA|nr:hypothetical protein TrLO_g9420 [Triparma laevis f. longispina]
MPFFKDISKSSNDALGDDYTSKVSSKMKTKAGPVGVTCETTRVSKDKVSLLSKLSFKWAGPSGFSVDKLQLKDNGSHVLETSLVGAAGNPNLKFTFKGDDSQKGDLGVEYSKGMLGLTAEMDIIELKKVSASALVTKGDLAFGGNGTFKMAGSSIDKFSLGASYSAGPIFAALTTDKFAGANLGLMYKVNGDLSIATSSSHSADKPLDAVTIGCVYNAPVGVVKAKCTSGGVASAVLVKDVAKKVTITPSLQVANGDIKNASFGFGVVMG